MVHSHHKIDHPSVFGDDCTNDKLSGHNMEPSPKTKPPSTRKSVKCIRITRFILKARNPNNSIGYGHRRKPLKEFKPAKKVKLPLASETFAQI